MKTSLLTDTDWTRVEGQLCLVTEFVPMAKIEGGDIIAIPGAPYASVRLLPGRAEPIAGFITHKTDFCMLWAAFNARVQVPGTRLEISSPNEVQPRLGADEEVCLIWTRSNYDGVSRLLGRFLPKLIVMVCAKRLFYTLKTREDAPEMAKILAWLKWIPEVMKS